jgi:hypothetical protein
VASLYLSGNFCPFPAIVRPPMVILIRLGSIAFCVVELLTHHVFLARPSLDCLPINVGPCQRSRHHAVALLAIVCIAAEIMVPDDIATYGQLRPSLASPDSRLATTSLSSQQCVAGSYGTPSQHSQAGGGGGGATHHTHRRLHRRLTRLHPHTPSVRFRRNEIGSHLPPHTQSDSESQTFPTPHHSTGSDATI